ncbi:unnamed protein product [Ectocarpus sp. 6 AP-2014]
MEGRKLAANYPKGSLFGSPQYQAFAHPDCIFYANNPNKRKRCLNRLDQGLIPNLKENGIQVNPMLNGVGRCHTNEWWAAFLATVDPFLGVPREHRPVATRLSLVDANSKLLGGVRVRAYSIFVWTTEPTIEGRMLAFQKFISAIVPSSSRTEMPIVGDADVFDGGKLVEWIKWKEVNSVMGSPPCGGVARSVPGCMSERDVVQELVTALDVADSVSDRTDGFEMISAACHTFLQTDFGKNVVTEIIDDGITNIPFGQNEKDALENASIVVDAGVKHMLTGTPHREAVAIKGQTRFALESRYLGKDTISILDQVAKVNAAVLRAVVDGAATGVQTYRQSVLANAKNTGEQMWHRDEFAHKVLARMKKSRRGRPEPPPFSAVVAFQDGTKLHVVRGSHRRGT